jgi:hypothetical protein
MHSQVQHQQPSQTGAGHPPDEGSHEESDFDNSDSSDESNDTTDSGEDDYTHFQAQVVVDSQKM